MTDAISPQTPATVKAGAEPAATYAEPTPARQDAERAAKPGMWARFSGRAAEAAKDAGAEGRAAGLGVSRLGLSRLALFVTVPVFCWVFYTTSSGMVDIMRRESGDWVGLVGAFIGTSAILTMLAATSWSLGSDCGALIARRQFLGERIVVKTLITGCVYLFVFSISVFFSFTYYYNNIFGLSSKKIASELQPMELAAEILLPAAKGVAEDYDAESARMVATPALRAYLDQLDALIQTGNNAGPALRESVRRAQEELQRAAAQAARKTANDLQEAQSAHRQLLETQAKVAALEKSAADLEPIIKAKQDEIAALATAERTEDQLALDASKGLDNLGATCGPNCLSHRTKADAARKRIATIRETLAGPTTERANAIKQRDALAGQLITLRQEEESALARRQPAPPKVDVPPDLAATLQELSQARVDIRVNPTTAKIREAKTSCSLLVSAERQANVLPASVGANFDCEPSGREAHDLLAARDEVITARAAFEQNCALDGAVRQSMQAISGRIHSLANSDRAAASAGFNEAKQLVDSCIVAGRAAGLGEAEVQALLKRSDQFLQTHSMERNRFELAREAFLKLTPDATMAIGVAVAQDAFMFVMKLLSEILKREVKTRERSPLPAPMDLTDSESDDCDIRVLKTLLRGARPMHGAMSTFDANTNSVAALPENVQENLVGLLNRLVRGGIAYVDRKGVYVLDDRTLIETENRLEAATKRKRLRAVTTGALNMRDDLLRFGDAQGREGDGSWRPRRGRSALEHYLTPRFLSPAAALAEDGEA